MDTLDKKELILNGNMYKAILSLSFPIMINNFIQTLYNLADAIWVGRLGSVEFAATSFVWPVIFLFISLGIGISIAGTSILSQLIGASEYEEANKYASQLITLSLIFSLVFSISGYVFSPYIIKLMGGTADLAIYSNTYLRISFLGFPFVFLYFTYNAIMTAHGNTVAPMILSALSAVLNIVLDPIFIFTLGMGVAGAAIATVISQALLAFVGIYGLRKDSDLIRFEVKDFKLNRKKAKKIIRIGLPASIGQSGAALGFVMLNSFIASYGTATLAAFGMVNRITSLLMQPPMGIGAGLTSIVGQNIGAKQFDRVHDALNKSIIITMILSFVGMLCFLWGDKGILNFFMGSRDDLEVIDQGLAYLRHMSLTMPAMGMFSIFQGFFQGSGHTRYSMIMDTGRLWGIRIPMILLCKHFTDLGATGIWFSMSSSNLLTCIYGYIVYRSGKWEQEMIGIDQQTNTF